MKETIIFNTCSIIGTGLIGGSIGLGLKKNKLVKRVISIGYRQKSISKAIEKGAADCGTTNIIDGVSEADLVIVATPVSLIPQKLKQAIPYLKDGAILTDVGSTKRFILQEFKNSLSNLNTKRKARFEFIGGHPIAGSENSGVEYAAPDLFNNSICVLISTKSNSKSAIKHLSCMWESLGATVITMTAEKHDKILSRTSHLPQMLAFSLANIIKDDQWKFSAGGLKDITRIASSDPNLWADICGQNQTDIINSIDLFIKELSHLRNELATNDNAKLLRRFDKARKRCNSFYKKDTRAAK